MTEKEAANRATAVRYESYAAARMVSPERQARKDDLLPPWEVQAARERVLRRLGLLPPPPHPCD